MLKKAFLLITIILPFIVIGQSIQFTEKEKSWIKSHPIINFGYEPHWAPYEIYENGEYSGIVGDYVKIIEKETGIDMVPIEDLTWEKTMKGLKSGEINIVPCCGVTDERKKFLDFSDIYINDPMVIVTRKDFSFVGDLEDLNFVNVALPKEYYSTANDIERLS